MARALLKNARMLLMDEATSNVDSASEALLQDTLRTQLSGCTVLAIAHRLHTIIDSDQILVIDAGVAAENGSPEDLMNRPNGKLRWLLNESNLSL